MAEHPAAVERRRGRRLPTAARGAFCWVPLLLGFFVATQSAQLGCPVAVAGEEATRRVGRTIRMDLPITGATVDRVRHFARRAVEQAQSDGARLVLIVELAVPAGQSEFGRGSEFGACLSLAELLSGEQLGVARTVAYVPQSIQGHAVLVALACDEIVMAAEASIGLAGVDEKIITPARRANYQEIADRRRTLPAPVALWMLDPDQQVFLVETELSREFVTPDGLEALRKTQTIRSQRPLFDPDRREQSIAAERGLLSGSEARRLGLIGYLAGSRRDVAAALELPPAEVEQDPSLGDQWRAALVKLRTPIDAGLVTQVQRLIDDEIRLRQVNFVCVWIDSPGGSLRDSVRLANYLGELDPAKVRTVAYIPRRALADAALVALACQQVVMLPDAELGGYGAQEFSADHAREAVRDRNGPWGHRSWSLPAALVDPRVEVFRYERPGGVAFFCEDELEEHRAAHPDGPPWRKGERVGVAGRPLVLSGAQAFEFGLADKVVADFAEFRRHYGLEHDPTLLEPGWADFLVDALASPGVAAFLLMIGFIALYVELQSPGIGVGGFVATVCFLMFFWANYLGGTAGWLEVTLFVAGVSCLLLEVFVLPGFGIFGLGGGAMVLASLILASQTFFFPRNPYQFVQMQRSLLTLAGAAAGFIVAAVVLRRFLPRVPGLRGVFLEPPCGEEAETIRRREALIDAERLLGARGTAATQLTPGGKARFGGELVDVISDGDLIPRGAPIEVVEVHGNRVLVRAVVGDR
jgi:membrane-bound serine protease (ClpP class)